MEDLKIALTKKNSKAVINGSNVMVGTVMVGKIIQGDNKKPAKAVKPETALVPTKPATDIIFVTKPIKEKLIIPTKATPVVLEDLPIRHVVNSRPRLDVDASGKNRFAIIIGINRAMRELGLPTNQINAIRSDLFDHAKDNDTLVKIGSCYVDLVNNQGQPITSLD